MSSIYADGGWLLPAILLVFVAVGVLAYRKRWPARKPQAATASSSTAPMQANPAPAQNKKGGGIASKLKSLPIGKIAGWVIGIVVALFILFHLVDIVSWVVNSSLHILGTKTVGHQPRATKASKVRTSAQASVRAVESEAQRLRIESQSYTLTLNDGDSKPDWIRVPERYKAVYETGQSSVGMDCSSGIDEPPQNADGESYWCNPGDIKARWFRPYIYQHAAKKVMFRYHFRHS